MRTSRLKGRGGDRGVTLVTFALSLAALCAVIALVLGGSIGYTAERNSQTASDASALAATRQLRQLQTGEIASVDLFAVANSVAQANGSDPLNPNDCEVIRADQSLVASCSTATDAQLRTVASGVRVNTGDTRGVPFGEVSGQEEIRADTLAAATIQPLAQGNSPFMICSSTGGSDGHEVRVLETTAPYEINPAAIGKHFVLWGNDMKNGGRQCGGADDPDDPAGSKSWRGWVNNDKVYSVPGWWDSDTGNKTGHLVRRLLIDPDGCDIPKGAGIEDIDGCVVAVPLCPFSNNGKGTSLELYCVRFGAFRLSFEERKNKDPLAPCQRGGDSDKELICGEFLGAAIATGGQGTTGQAGTNDVVLIKLVQ